MELTITRHRIWFLLLVSSLSALFAIGCDGCKSEILPPPDDTVEISFEMKWFVPQTDNLSLISAVHPVLSDGFAYSAMGKSIHKVDIESGEVIWKQTLDIPAFQGLSAFGMDSMIYDETIVFATSMTVVNALDKNDGHVLWSVDLADYGVLSVVNAAHFIYNDLFIYLGKNCVVKLDKETGVIYNILDLQQWIDDDGIQPGFAAVQQYEGVLYLPVAYNVNSTDLGAILCIDIESGALFWRKEFVPNDVTSLSSGRACAIQDSMLLLTTFKVIYGLDRFTGAIVWSDTLAGEYNVFNSDVTVREGMLLLGTNPGSARAFDVKTGAMLWETSPGRQTFWGRIGVSNGLVFYLTDRLYIMSLYSGELLASIDSGDVFRETSEDRFLSGPCVNENLIFIGSGQGFYCIEVVDEQ